MKILALDQALIKTGYAFVNNGELVDYGVANGTPLKNSLPEARREFVKRKLQQLVDIFNPDTVIIESCQYQKFVGVQSFATLTQLRTTLEDWMYINNVNYIVATPSQWRKPLGVKGKKREEQKASSIQIIKDKFGISVTDDEADAICMAYYVHKINLKKEGK